MVTSNMKLIGAFLIKLWSAQFFHHMFTEWPPAATVVFRLSIGFVHSRSAMAVQNMNLIHALVSQLRETQALACGGGCGGGDGIRTKAIKDTEVDSACQYIEYE